MKTTTKALAIAAATTAALFLATGAGAAEKIKLTMNWTADSAHLGFALAQKMATTPMRALRLNSKRAAAPRLPPKWSPPARPI